MAKEFVGSLEAFLGVPGALLEFTQLGDEFLVLGVRLQLAAILPELLRAFVHRFTEVFHDLLLVVKARVNTVERLEVLLEFFLQLLFAAGTLRRNLAEKIFVLAVKLFELIAKLW